METMQLIETITSSKRARSALRAVSVALINLIIQMLRREINPAPSRPVERPSEFARLMNGLEDKNLLGAKGGLGRGSFAIMIFVCRCRLDVPS